MNLNNFTSTNNPDNRFKAITQDKENFITIGSSATHVFRLPFKYSECIKEAYINYQQGLYNVLSVEVEPSMIKEYDTCSFITVNLSAKQTSKFDWTPLSCECQIKALTANNKVVYDVIHEIKVLKPLQGAKPEEPILIEQGEGENSIQQVGNKAIGDNSVAFGKDTYSASPIGYTDGYFTTTIPCSRYLTDKVIIDYDKDKHAITFDSTLNDLKGTIFAIYRYYVNELNSYIYVRSTFNKLPSSIDVDTEYSIRVLDNKPDIYLMFCGEIYGDEQEEATTQYSLYAPRAVGYATTAVGKGSMAQGYLTVAWKPSSHAEGYNTIAYGEASHAEGVGTIARNKASHVEGLYNEDDVDDKYLHIVGNGTKEKRSNAYTLDKEGNAYFAGSVELKDPKKETQAPTLNFLNKKLNYQLTDETGFILGFEDEGADHPLMSFYSDNKPIRSDDGSGVYRSNNESGSGLLLSKHQSFVKDVSKTGLVGIYLSSSETDEQSNIKLILTFSDINNKTIKFELDKNLISLFDDWHVFKLDFMHTKNDNDASDIVGYTSNDGIDLKQVSDIQITGEWSNYSIFIHTCSVITILPTRGALNFIDGCVGTRVFIINNESDLVTTPAGFGDIAEIIANDDSIEKAWQLIGADPTNLKNWANFKFVDSGDIEKLQEAIDAANAAATNANQAAVNANEKASAANEAAESATNAAQDANNKANLATTAANTANTAAQNADDKASAANTATTNANQAASAANTQGDYAKEQGDNAKASSIAASTAATNAADAAAKANEAANSANDAAAAANDVIEPAQMATTNANAAAAKAEEAAAKATLDISELTEKVNANTTNIDENEQTLNNHINNKNNPHKVTADQVGSYTKDETVAAIENAVQPISESLDTLWDLNENVTYTKNTNNSDDLTKINLNAQYASIDEIGGKTVVWNQLLKNSVTSIPGVTINTEEDGCTMTISGTPTKYYVNISDLSDAMNLGHTYLQKLTVIENPDNISIQFGWLNRQVYSTPEITKGTVYNLFRQTSEMISLGRGQGFTKFTPGTEITLLKVQVAVIDITNVFGAGDEPSTIDDPRITFITQYLEQHPDYNKGKLVSSDIQNVTITGKNLTTTTYTIPINVRNKPGYGISTRDTYNSMSNQGTGWSYIQQVGEIDLGTLPWAYTTNSKFFYVDNLNNFISPKYPPNNEQANILTAKYKTTTYNNAVGNNKSVALIDNYNNGRIIIKDLSFKDASLFKTSLNGVILYYELKEPVITDITDLMSSFPRYIPIEQNGSITFDEPNKLPTPNSVTYYTKTDLDSLKSDVETNSQYIGELQGKVIDIESKESIWDNKQDAINVAASKALVSDTNGHVSASDVTSTELSYLTGTTSNVQSQINNKADKVHTHIPSNIILKAGAGSAGSLDLVSRPLISSAASNKTFGLPKEAIVVEYSNDGGQTWIVYQDDCTSLFNESGQPGQTFYLGKKSTGPLTLDDMLRVTIFATDRFCSLNTLYQYTSSGSNQQLVFSLARSVYANPDVYNVISDFEELQVYGQPGPNIYYFATDSSFGRANDNQTSNYNSYRITYKLTSIGTGISAIKDIRFFGNITYIAPTHATNRGTVGNMLFYNSPYKVDANNSNVIFTEKVTAETFNGSLSGTATKATQDSDGNVIIDTYVKKSDIANIRHYGARWNKTQAQMTRLYDAASFPTAINNFAHRGSVNANYSNPFDNIYPWAGIKLCNISIDLYRNLPAGDSITKCVTAWEGDVDFSYNDVNGVWRYRPEFWGKSWEDDTYRYFDVSEKAIGSYVHYPEAIVGRWHGRSVSMTIGDTEKNCLIPSVGMPVKRIAMSTLHTYAKNYGATIDSIYSVDADTLLCIVEFATMNTQNAIGSGVSNLYRQSSDLIQEDATNSTTVKVLATAGSAYCIPGAIFDIGTSDGGVQVGSFTVVSATPNVGDAQYLDVTLDQAVTVTGANYWSVHGLVNIADEGIGSKSGYIGTNGKCNAYYRGIVMFGNLELYILGAYENKDDHHIWIANSDAEADNYDALDTTVHYDTGLVLPTAGGYTKKLGLLSRSGLLSIPSFCIETGGDSSNPVGDYFYNGSYTWNSILRRGGSARDGLLSGGFFCRWTAAESSADWYLAARPRLKNP